MAHALQESLKLLLKEAFEGPSEEWSWFTNAEENAGIFGILEGLPAEKASLSRNGSTIAAHADHVRYHMWGTNEFLRTGTFPDMDWQQSWQINAVNEAEWDDIKQALVKEFNTLLAGIDQVQWDEAHANEMLGSLAHAAYHLGALKQMIKA
ncbi:hypothetical protein [Aureibacillus halotolerans]|uniref:DinB family protein n=1 Tax=Aureibacillus halotolerans TaxID=1508390 RepID=A0A4R6UC45_9BACI|nr:hypothetical protein [Aureibacillus halotolerans]TDQ42653.1 hypothetical protein EV213_10182 [Aureibacillus halotolerans]